MITIPIYITDYELQRIEQEENDRLANLGVKSNKSKVQQKLVPFNINEQHLSGFWIDPDFNDDSKTIDIVIYVHGNSFRTPYTNEMESRLIDVLTNQSNTTH